MESFHFLLRVHLKQIFHVFSVIFLFGFTEHLDTLYWTWILCLFPIKFVPHHLSRLDEHHSFTKACFNVFTFLLLTTVFFYLFASAMESVWLLFLFYFFDKMINKLMMEAVTRVFLKIRIPKSRQTSENIPWTNSLLVKMQTWSLQRD